MQRRGMSGVAVEDSQLSESWGEWTVPSYTSASVSALRDFFRDPRNGRFGSLPIYAMLASALGAFLWLGYDRTLGNLIAWIRFGGNPGKSSVVARPASLAVQSPQLAPGPEANVIASYSQVPWYRRSSVNTIFIVSGFLTKGYLPLVLVTCALLLTGNIYYKQPDADGRIRTWSKANKVVAAAILLLHIGFLFYATGSS